MCLKVLEKNLREGRPGHSPLESSSCCYETNEVSLATILLCSLADDVCSLCGDWCSIEEKIHLFERLLGLQVR